MILKGRTFAATLLGVCAGTAASAQTPDGNAIGNPQLRDFALPGTRTTPPAAEPPPVLAAPSPPVSVPVSDAPRAAPARSVSDSAPRAAPAAGSRAFVETEPPPDLETATPRAPAPVQEDLAPVLPPPAEAAPFSAPVPARSASSAAPRPASKEDGSYWLYSVLAALLILTALIGVRRFRRAAPKPPEREIALFTAAPLAKAEPVPAAPAPAEPVADGLVGIPARPWIALEFKPDKAAATDTETSVQFELIVRNTGNTGARDLRITARMFNAGSEQEREIGAFFTAAAEGRSASAIAALAPGGRARLRHAVSLPRDQVREITIQGRRLFVPMVAISVHYEWGRDRSGQTAMSYLVGREAETPSEKMGGFRLDLGPRLYRSIGQRQTSLARMV